AANLVAQAFSGPRSRNALATYNFSGDLGKMAFPAATAWLLMVLPWRSTATVIGLVGLAAAAAILAMRGLPAMAAEKAGDIDPPRTIPATQPKTIGRGFPLLLSIAMI